MIVVGAGVTGLTAAWRLARAGRDVLVLEARGRVGGRLLSETHGARGHETDFEMGGQWVSPDQDALISLLDEFDLPTYARHRAGESLYVDRSGVRHRFTGDLPVAPATRAKGR